MIITMAMGMTMSINMNMSMTYHYQYQYDYEYEYHNKTPTCQKCSQRHNESIHQIILLLTKCQSDVWDNLNFQFLQKTKGD